MKMNRFNNQCRGGFTLLELAATTAILATLSVSSVVVVRTARSAWDRHHSDSARQQEGIALLRHIMRHLRQAEAVVAITPFTDTSGSLSLLMTNGDVLVWDHDSATKEVRFGVGSATELLAKNIEELTFHGYRADLTVDNSDVSLIHSIMALTRISSPSTP